MKKISLRMRLTLTTVLILTGICLVLTLTSMRNAAFYITEPLMAAVMPNAALTSTVAQEAYSFESPAVVESKVLIDTAYQVEMASVAIAAKQSFDATSILYMVVIIAAGGVITYLALGRALKPVRRLSEEIRGISEHELSQRISGYTAGDEISKLADSFNIMIERLDKAFSGQKRFASDAAHELKTPLAAIRTNIDVLQLDATPTASEYKQTVDVVKKQTERMIKLVDDLFCMSVQKEYDFSDAVSFDDIFHRIVHDLAPDISKNKLELTIEGRGYATVGNEVMLQRAFANIVENAVKYNRDGGSIRISMEQDAKHYTVKIADTGIGIPKEVQAHIFEPFFRVDSSRSRKAGGAGLGLAIVADSIARHGGSIGVADNKGGGIVFTVVLPVMQDSRTQKMPDV